MSGGEDDKPKTADEGWDDSSEPEAEQARPGRAEASPVVTEAGTESESESESATATATATDTATATATATATEAVTATEAATESATETATETATATESESVSRPKPEPWTPTVRPERSGARSAERSRRTGSGGPPWLRGRGLQIGLAAGVLLVAVTLWFIFGWLNARDYYLVCGPELVVAERGASSPWGRVRLTGPQWAPIEVRPQSQCEPATVRSAAELEEAFLRVLLREARARLTTGKAPDIAIAEKQLTQALLLTRARPDQRAVIERLQGDIEYWRAAATIEQAASLLETGAEGFKKAADRGPASADDAAQWEQYARELAGELRRGPPELRDQQRALGPDAIPFTGTDTAPNPRLDPTAPPAADEPPASDEPPPPIGTALPPHYDAAPPPPDAAPPTGGVLL